MPGFFDKCALSNTNYRVAKGYLALLSPKCLGSVGCFLLKQAGMVDQQNEGECLSDAIRTALMFSVDLLMASFASKSLLLGWMHGLKHIARLAELDNLTKEILFAEPLFISAALLGYDGSALVLNRITGAFAMECVSRALDLLKPASLQPENPSLLSRP